MNDSKKWAFVTGASSGLGVEFARQLAADGHHLILVARREQALQDLARELRGAHGIRVEIVVLDLGTREAAEALFQRTEQAGWQVGILQVASIAAYQGTPTYAAYAAAKAFVLFFSEALNHEWKGSGVCCTTLSPGITATEFLKVSGQKATLYQRMMMMQSPKVVSIGLRAMRGGQSTVVPGFLNKVTA